MNNTTDTKKEYSIEIPCVKKKKRREYIVNIPWAFKLMAIIFPLVGFVVMAAIIIIWEDAARNDTGTNWLILFSIGVIGLIALALPYYKLMSQVLSYMIEEAKAMSELKRKLIEDATIREIKIQEAIIKKNSNTEEPSKKNN